MSKVIITSYEVVALGDGHFARIVTTLPNAEPPVGSEVDLPEPPPAPQEAEEGA